MHELNDSDKQMIIDYYREQNKEAFFPHFFAHLFQVLFNNQNKIIVTEKKIMRGICKVVGAPYINESRAVQVAKCYFLMREVVSFLNMQGTPVYFINRVGLLKDADFSDSAKRRMKEHIDFPKMYENPEKYIEDIKELLGDKYSIDYFNKLGNISQVIKKGTMYEHEDIQSDLVNVIAGQRVTGFQPEVYEKTIHIYGRCGAFGYAVEDAETMPSQLQKILCDNGYNYKIINHGLWGAPDEIIDSNFLQDAKGFTDRDIVLFYRRHYVKSTLSMLENCGMWYRDINEDFYRFPEAKWCFYDKPGHMNRDGYKIVAKLIYNYLKEHDFDVKKVKKLHTNTHYWDCFIQSLDEKGFQSEIKKYTEDILMQYPLDVPEQMCGSIVMNCNPFTFGHRYLVEYAANQVDRLYVFVVQEDKSFFSFEDRFLMVKDGLADLKNVIVVPSGKFMISALTFPQYFMKDFVKEKNFDVSGDLELFCEKIAPRLRITKRFAGEEPIDPVTARYNESMKKILPRFNIEFVEIPRLKLSDTEYINATAVRQLLKEGQMEALKKYVPDSTYKVLQEKYVRG